MDKKNTTKMHHGHGIEKKSTAINLPVRKQIHLTIKSEVFGAKEFEIFSESIDLMGFKWFLEAKTGQEGYLTVFLHAKPQAEDLKGYRIEIDRRIFISNTFAGKDIMMESIGSVYDDKIYTGRGYESMAKIGYLLDPKKGFLQLGNIKVWADFTIKQSTTLNHLA